MIFVHRTYGIHSYVTRSVRQSLTPQQAFGEFFLTLYHSRNSIQCRLCVCFISHEYVLSKQTAASVFDCNYKNIYLWSNVWACVALNAQLFNLYFLSRQYWCARLSREVAWYTYCLQWWTKVTCACDATTMKSVRFLLYIDNVERIRACYDVRHKEFRVECRITMHVCIRIYHLLCLCGSLSAYCSLYRSQTICLPCFGIFFCIRTHSHHSTQRYTQRLSFTCVVEIVYTTSIRCVQNWRKRIVCAKFLKRTDVCSGAIHTIYFESAFTFFVVVVDFVVVFVLHFFFFF